MKLPAQQSVCFNIKTAWHGISRMYNNGGSEFELSASLGFVLLNIDLENGTAATKIAPLIGMETRSLTRMLKSMEENGLIYKQAAENDKRSVLIFLTEKGKERRELAKLAVKTFNNAVREEIPEEKLKIFFEVINEINKVVDNKPFETAKRKQQLELVNE
jgi:DNA-binding MarR family transcriptional regulator